MMWLTFLIKEVVIWRFGADDIVTFGDFVYCLVYTAILYMKFYHTNALIFVELTTNDKCADFVLYITGKENELMLNIIWTQI